MPWAPCPSTFDTRKRRWSESLSSVPFTRTADANCNMPAARRSGGAHADDEWHGRRGSRASRRRDIARLPAPLAKNCLEEGRIMARRSVFGPSFPVIAVALAACGGDGGAQPGAPDAPVQVDAPAGAAAVLKRPSKSSTVAISDDDQRVVMVNPQDDSISIFRTSDLA